MCSNLEQLFGQGREKTEIEENGKNVVAYKTPPVNGIQRTISKSCHLKADERHLAVIIFPKSKCGSTSKTPTPVTSPPHTPLEAPEHSNASTHVTDSHDKNQKGPCSTLIENIEGANDNVCENQARIKRLGKNFKFL